MSQDAKPTQTKPDARVWFGAIILLIAVLIIGMTIYSRVARFSDAVKKQLVAADAGFKKATNTIDAEALRAWALESAHGNGTYQTITNTIPKEMLMLYDEPPEVEVDKSGVTLSWGGGFFHWVLYIGATNDILPHISDNKGYPLNFEWRPGIYYTREANQELQ